MRILAIDPGTTQSGWVLYNAEQHEIMQKGVCDNHALVLMLEQESLKLVDALHGDRKVELKEIR